MFYLGSKAWDNERYSIWNGSFSTMSINIVNGFVAMYLLDALHASNAEIGLLNSLPSLVYLFSMLGAAFFIRKTRSKKWFCVKATVAARSFYLYVALVPLLPIQDAAIWVVWLMALNRIPQSFGDLSWQALISDLIPPERRSGFFSERNRMLTIVSLLSTLLAGMGLQQFNKHWVWPYQILFGMTIAFAAVEVYLLIRHDENRTLGLTKEPSWAAEVGALGHKVWRRALGDKPFVRAVIALLFFNFGWQMSWPLFSIYQIHNAHAPAMWIALFSVASSLAQVVTYRWWGRLADKYGNGWILAIAAAGMASAPLLTMISTNLTYLLVISLVTGVPLAGTQLLLFNYLLEHCPESDRTNYIAYYNVVVSFIGFIAPEFGIWCLDKVNIQFGMTISGILRLFGGAVFWWLAWASSKAYRLRHHTGRDSDLNIPS